MKWTIVIPTVPAECSVWTACVQHQHMDGLRCNDIEFITIGTSGKLRRQPCLFHILIIRIKK